jgi:hypothetical protein
MRKLLAFVVAAPALWALTYLSAQAEGRENDDRGCRRYLPAIGRTVDVPCDDGSSTEPKISPEPTGVAPVGTAGLSFETLDRKYGGVEKDSDGWFVKRGVSPLSRGYDSTKLPQYDQFAHGEQITLMQCKSICSDDTGCAALYWGSAHASNADVCYLYKTQVIDTVSSQSGGVWFKRP